MQTQLNTTKNFFIDIVYNRDNKINRLTRAAIPYFNFYGPFSKVAAPLGQYLLVGDNAFRGFQELTKAVNDYQLSKQALPPGSKFIPVSKIMNGVVYIAI